MSLVIAEKPVAPFDEAFLTGLGDDGMLDDRQISSEQLSTLPVELFPYPDRKARLDPVVAKQFIRGPSQKRARVPIDEHDPPFQIQREQDDVGRVQISLCTIPLGVTATVDADARTLTIEESALEPHLVADEMKAVTTTAGP